MRDEAGGEITLHLQCGLPIVGLEGAWDAAKPALLTKILDRLASAGHGEIVLNLSGMPCVSFTNRDWFDTLERLAGRLRSRRGRLGVVIGQEQAVFVRQQTRTLARWAATEEEAICYLKGVPRASVGIRIAARLNLT